MSTFTCPVVRIGEHHKHPNADTLRVTEIEGSTCIFKEGAFETGDLALFIPVEAMVPLENEAFAWLRDPQRPNKTHYRVKAKKLRGVFSDGFLTPVWDVLPDPTPEERGKMDAEEVGTSTTQFQRVTRPDGSQYDQVMGIGWGWEPTIKIGDDLAPLLKIEKFVEELPGVSMGKQIADPYGPEDVPVYDMEAWKKNKGVFTDPNEEVVITEKIHGTNSRFMWRDGQLWVGSRNRFLRFDETNVWWKIANEHLLEIKLQIVASGLVFFGEVYGVQDLKYDCEPGKTKFAIFDIYDTVQREYLGWYELKEMCKNLELPLVPVLYEGPIGDQSIIENMTNPPLSFHSGENQPYKSSLGSCIREGVVVKPVIERWNEYTHRTILKSVSHAYLLRKNGTEAQ